MSIGGLDKVSKFDDTNCFNVVLNDVYDGLMEIGVMSNKGRGKINAGLEVLRTGQRTWHSCPAT